MKLIKPIISTILTILILAWAIPTISYLNWTTLLIAAIVLTLLQKIVRPILKILFLPINIVTLGLFSIVINMAMLWLATYLVPGFEIRPMVLMGVHLGYLGTLFIISFLVGFLQSFIAGLL